MSAGRGDGGAERARRRSAVLESLDDFLCFTPGCRVATPQGARPVEDLVPGDRVLTRDNGMQEIAWSSAAPLGSPAAPLPPRLLPVAIRRGALGGGLPQRDIMVSPGHRMLRHGAAARHHFGEGEVLVAARDLVGLPGIERRARRRITYVHFMCEHHEIVLADGAWSESFQPGDRALAALDPEQRAELMQIFPGLAGPAGQGPFAAARRALQPDEARLLRAG